MLEGSPGLLVVVLLVVVAGLLTQFTLCVRHHIGGTKALLPLTSGPVSIFNHDPVCHCRTLN